MQIPYITAIQRYSIHDGDGIRTTVFFKGCPLRCRWCHNPETQAFGPELLFRQEQCTGCGSCRMCPQGAVSFSEGRPRLDRSACIACGACAEACFHDAREICGKQYPVAELVRLLQKDQPFYESSGGGVTLSGGEVMAQDTEYLEALAKALARQGISIFLDTCGACAYTQLARLLPYVDAILYDVKAVSPDLHRELTGAGNGTILDNLRKLSQAGAKLWIRIPVIGGANDSDGEFDAIGRFLGEIQYQQVHLLPYHDTGRGKYRDLDRAYPGSAYTVPNPERLRQLGERLERMGVGPVYLGGAADTGGNGAAQQ